ncbi:MAG TPA: DNA-binding protein [Pirellulaceae bacterium]|jgi:hypothetical protein|nr:DNA-binding protein [Pirellulaceae bacterium]
MSAVELRQLQANGFVSAKSMTDSAATEAVVARRYGGGALGDRVVVQLCAKRLTPAVDLAMEYLGLAPQGESEVVARQHRHALGFADWALMRHPKHARYALDLVKRIKASARRAKSKPGHAWEEFAAMSTELDKSVRNFLPAFWEEAARIFKEHGNQTYAGRALNKALEAERVHAIEVDREHRRDAVLEFTLRGCLSGKALSDYAKDLQKQFDPPEAYATLRDLAVRRTLGGMPPTAAMGTDLLRLAKAAKLDVDQEIESVLEEMIPAPAMARAPLQFWKSVSAHARRIVKRNPAFAMWLLVHTQPQASYRGNDSTWQWIELLDEWKVLEFLWKEDVPSEPEIPGGRAGWIGRLARLETSPDKRIFELLEKSAATIRKEDKPVPLFEKPRWGHPTIDVDVLEACIDLGLPLDEFPESFTVSFEGWLRAEVDHPRRNSSLEKSYADPRVAAGIREQVPTLLQFKGESPQQYRYGRQLAPRRAFEEAAENHPVVDQAWWEYLDGELRKIETGGLPDAEIGLKNLRDCVTPRTAARFQELAKRLAKIDLADTLQRTLAAGVLDEYGWPALEAAAKEAPIPARNSYGENDAHWVFPALLYRAGDELIVVRGDAWSKRKLGLKKDEGIWSAIPVGEDACVTYRDASGGWKWMLRWLSDPKNDVEITDSVWNCRPECVVEFDGGAFVGSRTIHPGEGSLPKSSRFFHDGERFWRPASDAHELSAATERAPLVEVDPRTGQTGRESVPKFFEEDLPPGAVIQWTSSRLLPLPPSAPGPSPAGSRDGLIGWLLATRRDGSWHARRIDGRPVEIAETAISKGRAPLAMVDQPCGDSHWLVTVGGHVSDAKTGIAIADYREQRTTYCSSWPAKLPVEFLHYLRLRHEPSSKKLRKLSKKEAAALLDAAIVHHQALWDLARQGQSAKDDPKQRASQKAVETLLSGAPVPLVEGISKIARIAAAEAASLNNLRQTLSEGASAKAAASTPTIDPARISAGMLQLAQNASQLGWIDQSRHEKTDSLAHLSEAAEFLKGKAKSAEIESCFVAWPEMLADLPATGWKIFWKTATDESLGPTVAQRLRQPWLDAFERFGTYGILDLPGALRVYAGKATGKSGGYGSTIAGGKNAACTTKGDSRYVRLTLPGYPQDAVCVLEYAPKGKFQAPDGIVVESATDIAPAWKQKETAAFVAAVRKVQELPFVSAEKLREAAEALDVTPVEVGIAWMGNLRTVRYGRDTLTKQIREKFGWKTKQVEQAIAALGAAPPSDEVLGHPVRKDPTAPFGEGRDAAFDAMVAAWAKARGNVFRIPAELVKTLEASVPRYRSFPVEGLVSLYQKRGASEFLQKRTFAFALEEGSRHGNTIEKKFFPEEGSDFGGFLEDVVYSIRLFHYASPAGEPVRRALPELIDALRAWLDDESTVLPFGLTYVTTDFANVDAAEIVSNYERLLGKFERGPDGLLRRDEDLIAAALMPPYVETVFRPARMRDDEAFARLVAAAGLSMNHAGDGSGSVEQAKVVRALRSDAISRMAELDRAEPNEPGKWDHDPRRSAPETVADVANNLKLSEDSAVAYLQILALPDPTSANLAKRNDWTTAKLKKAVAPLIEAGLLVQAKRARAGREAFLPGGWEALKAPNLPIETWKLPLYGLAANRPEEFRIRLILPKGTVGDLFRAAWARYRSGDVPKYEEA